MKSLKILALSFFLFSANVFAESECDGALNKKGEVALFNSTICPQDINAQRIYKIVPFDVELANAILPLEYHSEIKRIVNDELEKETSPYKSPAAYANVQKNIYQPLIYIILFVVLISVLFKAYKVMISNDDDGEGKQKIGHYIMMVLFCLVLVYPIPVKINDETGYSSLIKAAFARLHLLSSGVANMFGSAAMAGLEDSQEYVVLTKTGDNATSESIAIDSARAYIEEAVCLHNTTLANIHNNAKEDGISADRSLRDGGEIYSVSQSLDRSQSVFEVFKDSHELRSGWMLDDVEDAQVCVTRSLLPPQPNEMTKALANDVFNTANHLNLVDVTEYSIQGAWLSVFAKIGDLPQEIQEEYANYFFSVLRWRVEGGDALDNTDTANILQRRFDLAKAFVKEYVADDCMIVRTNYMDTEKTISHLNQGSIAAPSFSLGCAIVEDGKLAMAYDADSSDPNEYVRDVAKLKASHPTKLLDIHRELVDSFKPVEMLHVAYKNALRQIAVEVSENIGEKTNISDEIKQARFGGYIKIARDYLTILESDAKAKDVVSSEKVMVQALSGVQTDSNISVEKGFLPITSALSAEQFILPSFIYAKPLELGSSENVGELVEESFEAQLLTGQGGNADSQTKSAGVQYLEVGAESVTTHNQLVDSAIVTLFDRIGALGKPLESTMAEYNDTELLYLVEQLCLDLNTTTSDVEALGVSIDDYNALCEAHFSNALIANKKMAYQALNGMTNLVVIGATASGGITFSKAITKKYKTASADKQKVKNEGNAFADGLGLPEKGVAGVVANKIKGFAEGLYNSSALAGTMSMVIGGGTLLALVSLATVSLPNLLFEVLVFANFGFIYLLSLLSPLLILWIMVVGLDAQRGNTLRSWIVRSFLYPVMGIVMLSTSILLSSLAAKVNNAVIGTMLTSSRDFSLANPESVIISIFVLLATTGTYFYILYAMIKTFMDYTKEAVTWLGVKSNNDDAANSAATIPLVYAMGKAYGVGSEIGGSLTRAAQAAPGNLTKKQERDRSQH